MKKLFKLFCTCVAFIFIINFTACTQNNNDSTNNTTEEEQMISPTCTHDYKFTTLSINNQSEIEKPGIYTCSKCNETKTEEITYREIGLPTIDFSGSLDGISKENELKISVKYSSEDQTFECDAKIKVQGASSAGYPKKNYTIKFYEKDTDFDKKHKVELVDGWGKENKYCLKANWIDYSQARNVVSAKLYGQVAHSRNIQDEINDLYNGGAIDGYPVVIYLNGSFLGLYTMNIPKDKWLLDMSDYDPEEDETVKKQAILMGNKWSKSSALKETMNPDYISSGWELEYCSTEKTDIGTNWVSESFNNFITFLNNSSDDEIKTNLSNYVDIDRAIDCFIYTNVIHASDNTAKNMLWATYDGVKWIPSMYDMDGTWGLVWNGSLYSNSDISTSVLIHNKLYETLVKLYFDDVKARYIELRGSVLSLSNIEETFTAFFDEIPSFVREAEKTKWSQVPSQETNNLEQIIKFTGLRLTMLDEYFVF